MTSQYTYAKGAVNRKRIKNLSNWLLNQCGVKEYTVSILLVDDKKICQLNNQYRQKNQPTNVLSFPFAEGADRSLLSLPVRELGDIVISVDTAFRESIEYRQNFHDRIAWLLIHGLLHLLGYDHEKSTEQAQKMSDKENELLNKLHFHRRTMMTKLAINVDHVATIRQARGINEPDPVAAAAICELAGASGIVVHLREDRRHMQDRDIYLLRQTVKTTLNLEMGANKEIIKIALDLKPDIVTLVPENRQELTTEGGLDVISQKKKIAKVIDKMEKRGIPVSIFSDPDPRQLKAVSEIGATFVELHTGRYCEAASEDALEHEFQLIATAAEEAHQLGLRVFAGHGLDYQNTAPIAALDMIEELSIGHAIISRAVFTGLDQAVKEMAAIINQASLSF
ncbi:MAG: pyridoxine 5'-phosphate synthase [Deltaproteobacteria bacterium]|nr:pyridoxine 5'-phosphate synthase [Deltaproteobacteria bacterium]